MSKLYSVDPIKLSDEILRRIEIVFHDNEDPFFSFMNQTDYKICFKALNTYKIKEKDYDHIRFIFSKLQKGEKFTPIEFQFLIKSLYLQYLISRDEKEKNDSHELLNDILYMALGEKYTIEKLEHKGYLTIKNPKRQRS